ncbi:hypothetical protein [Pseudoalteromonas marina]|uniref:Uncharacterized protein n=1 Tax=Pseudoalteromonas marina TaxID=267375 RepID=A0ABT9FI95_9GAMM|nr:hypothetical protein [Pseudoalteromonas marina]MDP2566463.1 hypothetical protein [Pseudoalteromonas marina]
MITSEQTRTLSSALLTEDGRPQHFHISPNADNIPILVISLNDEISTFKLASKSISQIVSQELPSIVNALNLDYTNRDFNKARKKHIKVLTEQLIHLEQPLKKVAMKDAYNSIAGHFYKNNKWISFSIYRSKKDSNDILLRYARREVGISIKSITKSSFDEVFNSLFNFACKKIGIEQDARAKLIRGMLKEHLEKKYKELLDEGKPLKGIGD